MGTSSEKACYDHHYVIFSGTPDFFPHSYMTESRRFLLADTFQPWLDLNLRGLIDSTQIKPIHPSFPGEGMEAVPVGKCVITLRIGPQCLSLL